MEIVQGADPGALDVPRMLLKVGIITIVALIIWTALFVVMEYGLIARDDFPV